MKAIEASLWVSFYENGEGAASQPWEGMSNLHRNGKINCLDVQ